jgi:hypothetical protein
MISIRSGKVDGEELPLIAPADGTKYLGVKVNSWTGVTKETTGEKLELWCSRIDKASLKPRQNLVMLNQYAIQNSFTSSRFFCISFGSSVSSPLS